MTEFIVKIRSVREGGGMHRGQHIETGEWVWYATCPTRNGALNTVWDARNQLLREGCDDDYEFTIEPD